MKQKISLKDKKIRTHINGKFNGIGGVDLVIRKLILELNTCVLIYKISK